MKKWGRTYRSRHLIYPELCLRRRNGAYPGGAGYAGKHYATKVLTCRVSILGQSLCPARSSAMNLNLRHDIFSPYDDRTDSVCAAHHCRTHRPVFTRAQPEASTGRAHWPLFLLLLQPLRYFATSGVRVTSYICCVKS